ncbi:MAG TPA: hypothetical protein O0X13_02750 [Methanocorpusculum sp.]|nr:hypothetical protein [Methanocorpusculum sp.]HJK84634.1 hypothetical protein [Methanocorpusculum sp.]
MAMYPKDPKMRAIFLLWQLTNGWDDVEKIIPLNFETSEYKEYITRDKRSGLQILDTSSKHCISVEEIPNGIEFNQCREEILRCDGVASCSTPLRLSQIDGTTIDFVLIDHTEEYTHLLLEECDRGDSGCGTL